MEVFTNFMVVMVVLFHNIYVCEIITLYILNLYNVYVNYIFIK